MNLITGKHLSRRTFLRGAGASVGLPLLDAMVPAGRAWRDPAEGFVRMVGIEESHGCAGANEGFGMPQNLFAPAKLGRDFDIGPNSQLKAIEEYKEYLTVVSMTDSRMAEPWSSEEIGADHQRSTSVFLTQSKPNRTQGADVFLGKSIDQIHASKYGQETVLPSLECTTEDMQAGGGCGGGYSCVYKNVVAWASATEPLPATLEPRIVFEQLFGAGDSATDRAGRIKKNRSVLDFIAGELARLKRELAPVDQQGLEAYTTNIREVERRIALVEAQNQSGEARELPEAPSGVPDRWEDHMEIMFDLQHLALQADLTRVITMKIGFDLSNKTFPDSGTNKSFHGLSHHAAVPANIMEFNLLNTYRLNKVGYLLEKLKNTMEGDKSLLDKSVVIFGSPMGDANLHAHRRCPLILMGHANGVLEGNLHLKAPEATPMANVFVDLMERLGHDNMRGFGDSTGTFPLALERGA